MTYNIEVKKSVLKVLKKIPREDQIHIAKTIKGLADDPRPAYCLKLAGSAYYRIRCGNYRIIYDVQDDKLIIIILKVGHRKDIYKRK
ncbi:MAG: type II toxin-antitoxin system RelE/ParE family toxin [Candidatus Omnitrophica bacterium]|nr:type II toxin-antitoxin system RelE/ParE family toxin [Candidatus Omnitrophota bacterium]